jgi:pyruvate dehydrogenase E1 component beta subunit
MPWTKVAIENLPVEHSLAGYGRGERQLSYAQALREALSQALKKDNRVFAMGEGIDDPGGIFGSTVGLAKEFGKRVFDTPIAENGLTGFAIGAAITGSRPVLIHMRMDFLPLTFDQILNHAAKLFYMSGGRVSVPLVIRSIIGRGWGSAAQHSQALHALLLHMPGIKVVMPSSAYDAKGLLLAAIADNNPVILAEHRWLYERTGFVPEEEYIIPLGKGIVRREGKDATVLAFSLMVDEALKAADALSKEGKDIEVIDPRSLNPFDEELVVASVKKTGRLLIADLGWQQGGVCEIFLGRLHNRIRPYLKNDVKLVALPDAPTPASHVLEAAYYKNAGDIIAALKDIL